MLPRKRVVRLLPRGAIPFLIAIVLPCTVLAGLTLRMMTLQGELAEKRRAEMRTALIAAVGSEVWSQLERLRLSAMTRGGPAMTGPAAGNDAIVLVARLENGRMVLPWAMDAGLTGAALHGPGAYADAIRAAERAEQRPDGADEALAAFGRAIGQASSPAQAAFARLGLSRSLEAARRTRAAALADRDLFRTPLLVRDDVGTPFALYGARRQLARSGHADIDYRGMVGVLEECLIAEPPLPPSALYMVRDLADRLAGLAAEEPIRAKARSLRSGVTTLSREREQALALQEQLAAVLPVAASVAASDAPWALFGPSETAWLVSATTAGPDRASAVVAVRLTTFAMNMQAIALLRDNGIRVVSRGTAPGAEPLGGMLPALGLTLPEPQPVSLSREESLQRRFYAVALFLVIGIAWSGGYFFWQHVRRDLRIAEMRSQFVASVSHELKTPLTSIRMFAETLLLGRTARAEVRDEYLETIVNESERLTRLINNVLDYSKIEQGIKTYRLVPQSLVEIIEASARVMEYPLLKQGFELRRTLDPSVPRIPVDRDAIQQAVLNLLNNAMKYSGSSRTIELTLAATDREISIGVTDKGCGIAATEQDRVFQKFYRSLSAEQQDIPGTGLGLTIVEHVAAAHGGRVTVSSAVGEGSTFSIVLPVPLAGSSHHMPDRTLDSAHASHPGH